MADESKAAVGGVGTEKTSKTTANKTEESTGKRAGNSARKAIGKAAGRAAKKTEESVATVTPHQTQIKTQIQTQVQTQTQPPLEDPEEAEVSGVEKLRLAADQLLFEIADEVVKKLEENAKRGKLDCTKLLVTLADKKPVRKRRSRGNLDSITWLLRLAAEPEFRELAQSAVHAVPVVVQG